MHGLEKHLLESADIDAPDLMGVTVPLLLYADDLNLMSETASGFQRQLDALASFCEQRLLTVSARPRWWSLERNKMLCVILGSMVQWWNMWTATNTWGLSSCHQLLHFGTEVLMAVASKALFAMDRHCAFMGSCCREDVQGLEHHHIEACSQQCDCKEFHRMPCVAL